MTTKGVICVVAAAIAVIAASVAVSIWATHRPLSDPDTAIPDTVWRYKTVYKDKPEPASSWRSSDLVKLPLYVFCSGSDTTVLVKTDTVHDTCYVFVERTHRYYEEEGGKLRIWISGIEPSLDRYELTTEEATITKRASNRNHLTFEAGFRLLPGLSVPVSVEYARSIGNYEIFTRGGYDYANRSAVIDFGGRYSFSF